MGNLVAKHNALIEASYRLTLSEIRLIVYGISLINPIAKEFPLSYVINIDRYAELFNLDKNHLYQEIKDIARKKLFRREFSYTLDDGKTRITRWLSAIDYEDKTGFVELHFPQTLKPLLHQLKQNFTTYHIEKISKFKSIYSVRIYEQAIMKLKKSNEYRVAYKTKIEQLKELLGVSDKYKHFPNFKKYCLEKSKQEINKHSDIKMGYEVIKQGRTPHEIKFTVSHKESKKEKQFALPLAGKTTINLSPDIIEKAKNILLKQNNRLDIYNIVEQFKAYAQNNETPKNVNGAFIGFVKKKIGKSI